MKTLLMVISMLLFSHAAAQEHTETEQQLEQLAEEREEAIEDDGWLEMMQQLHRHPVPINKATEEELQQITWLHPVQIQQLLQYRKSFGKLVHVYELQAVPGWDVATIKKVLPYISIEKDTGYPLKQLLTNGEHLLLSRVTTHLQDQAGYDRSGNNHYAGSKIHLMLRYRYRFQNSLQWGYTGDKDAGEPFMTRKPKGFDFNSFHFFLRRRGIIRSIAIGDYTINMGQGLIQWQSLAFKKGSDAVSIKRQSAVIRPYQSSGEFYFNRGVAFRLAKNKYAATFFISSRKLDGNTDVLEQQKVVTSFATSGLHRTANERNDKSSVHQLSYGGALQYHYNGGSIGLNAVRHSFSLPLQKKGEPYQLFAISGRTWFNMSMDYSYTYRNLHFFGEAAADKRGAVAVLQGLMVALDKKVALSLLYRQIPKNYQALYGNAFTEQALPSNENGSYLGLRIRPSVHWRFDGYFDFFRFPWLRFRVHAPGNGSDYLLQLSYLPGRQTEIYIRFRKEEKDINVIDPVAVIASPMAKAKSNFRVHAAHELSPSFGLKTRCEVVWYDRKGALAEEGFLFYVEGAVKLHASAAANMRFQYFETGGFNSRMYAYESDVLYGFSIPAVFDKGFRFYANLRYTVIRDFTCWLRFAQTVYSNRSSSGSGLNLIKGNTVSEVKIQASYRF